jgi:hypothetical protein
MADYIPFTNCVEVLVNHVYGGQDMDEVHGFLFATDPTASDLVNLNHAVHEAWFDQLKDTYSTDVTLNAIKSTNLTTSTSPVSTFFPSTDNIGTLTGNALPNNVAICVSYQTALRGRSYRGRTYHGGLTDAAVDDTTHISSTYQTNLAVSYIAFFAQIETDVSGVHVILSRRNGGAPRTVGAATEVESVSVDLALDSMRRRLAGRGT